MNGILIGFALGALLFGGVAIKYERARRASRDLEAAKAGVEVMRSVFWRAVSALVSAAAVPLIVAAVLITLYLIGESKK